MEVAPLVVRPNPLALEGRQVFTSQFLPRETLGDYVLRVGVEMPRSEFVVSHNGHRVPGELWPGLIPRQGDIITIASVGRGSGSGNKIIGTVLMIALTLSAPYLAGAMQGLSWGTAATGFWGQALTTGILLGGSLLISPLLQPPKAIVPKSLEQASEAVASYAISAGRNSLRPWEPLPLIFGRHKVVPDLGAQYFTEWVGDVQYLNQVFHFGLHDEDIELTDFRIGSTPLAYFKDVQTQISGADGKLTLFPGNVDTIEGFTLDSGVQTIRRTNPNVVRISIELAAQLYEVKDDGSFASVSVDLRVQWRRVGDANWTDVGLLSDAVYATHYWALMEPSGMGGSDRQIDYGSTNPAEHYDGEPYVVKPASVTGADWVHDPIYSDPMMPGYWTPQAPYNEYNYITTPEQLAYWRWVPHPHSQGKPWQGIAPDPLISVSTNPGVRLTGKRQEPTRTTVNLGFSGSNPTDSYEVRVWKVTADEKTNRKSNEVAVNQIRVTQRDEANYAGQKRVAVRIKATSQLNGAIDELSAIAVTKAGVWDGNGNYPLMQTRNPAWSFIKFALGKRVGTDLVYGLGYYLTDLDLDAIHEWAAWCDQKNLRFDWVLNQSMSAEDVLNKIARAGRASITHQSGRLGVIWDEANLPVTAMFGPMNIRAGTFEVYYLNSEDSYDELIGSFLDENRDWEPGEVRVQVPGTTTHNRPLRMDMEGMTREIIVGRELNLLAASQVWHRRRVVWETDIEGWVIGRGGIAMISHDLTVWDYSGRFVQLVSRSEELLPFDIDGQTVYRNQVTVRVKLSVSMPSGGSGYLMLRDPENNFTIFSQQTDQGEIDELEITRFDDEFRLPGDPAFEGASPMDWAFFFGPESTPGRRFKIVSVQPTKDQGVRFEAVDDGSEYYASELNPYQYTPPRDGALLAGKVLGLRVAEGYYNTISKTLPLTFTWALSITVPVVVDVVVNDTHRPSERGLLTSIIVTARRGDVVTVTVHPEPVRGKGEPAAITHTVQASASQPSDVGRVTARVEGTQVRLQWPASPEPDVDGYEVRASDSGWGSSGALFRGDALSALVEAGEPGSQSVWYVRPYNGERLYSASSSLATFTVEPVPTVFAIDHKFQDTSLTNATLTLSWPSVQPQFGLKGFTVSATGLEQTVDSTTITLPADWIGSKTYQICTIDNRGFVSEGAQVSIEKLLPNSPTNLRAQTIDNNVLLYWNKPAPTTLPFDHILLKSGQDWSNADVIGTLGGEFASISELEAGDHTYWLAAVDTDGWESEPVSLVVNVNEPPDFVFRGERQSALGGVLTNAYKTPRGLLLPVDTSQTWAQHFTSNAWSSPQDQIDAGYPVYAQPTLLSGSYVETFDFETTIGSSRVTLLLNTTDIVGSPDVTPTIETSQDGSSWSVNSGVTETFATNFRYVRVTVDVSQAGDTDLVRINALSVRLSSKLKNDAGIVQASSSDANGTVANFNVHFLDVSSIVLTPAGTSQLTAVYDFKDVVQSGTYSFSGGVITVSISSHGLLPGMAVRLALPGRSPEVVVIDTATTNSFTASLDGSGSGNLQAYAQGMSVYLFDDTGARASGAVSWAVRGN